jgi:hypothetical protein
MRPTRNIIVDLDGTLALERHRRHHIKKGWEYYFEHIHLDPVNESVLELLHAFEKTHDIFIFTSRPEQYRRVTEEWLQRHDVPFYIMEMRRPEDTNLEAGEWQKHKSDNDIKLEMIMRHQIGPANTMCVLEDRDEMVIFYRNLGFDCWQVHPQHELFVPD